MLTVLKGLLRAICRNAGIVLRDPEVRILVFGMILGAFVAMLAMVLVQLDQLAALLQAIDTKAP